MQIENVLKKVLGFGTEEFIKKGIAGGYEDSGLSPLMALERNDSFDAFVELRILRAISSPAFWRAVGSVEGWPNIGMTLRDGALRMEWQHKMHRFIDALAKEV